MQEQGRPDINIVCEKIAFQGLTRFEDRQALPLGVSTNFTAYSAKLLDTGGSLDLRSDPDLPVQDSVSLCPFILGQPCRGDVPAMHAHDVHSCKSCSRACSNTCSSCGWTFSRNGLAFERSCQAFMLSRWRWTQKRWLCTPDCMLDASWWYRTPPACARRMRRPPFSRCSCARSLLARCAAASPEA